MPLVCLHLDIHFLSSFVVSLSNPDIFIPCQKTLISFRRGRGRYTLDSEHAECGGVLNLTSFGDAIVCLVVSILDQRPRGRGFEACRGRSRSNRGPVALCTLGLDLLKLSILSGSVNEYRLQLGRSKAGM